MGTLVFAQGTESEPLSDENLQRVLNIFHDVDLQMSEWKPDSPLSMVNLLAGNRPVKVPSDVFNAVKRSLEIAKLTSGCFDPTWAAFWELWDFSPSTKGIVPSKEQIESRLPLVNWEAVQMNDQGRTIFLPESGMMLGLGGIAKGVAVDQSATELKKRGIKNFMLVAGGQVFVSGTHDGIPWKVGIRQPGGKPDALIATIHATDTCISTSGDYEKYFESDGLRYHHIIDPRTGFPARGIRSVTVITPDATLADALSTALFVLGADRALELVDDLPDVEAVIINSSGKIRMSSQIADQITLFEDEL